jgi:hypothetical protein
MIKGLALKSPFHTHTYLPTSLLSTFATIFALSHIYLSASSIFCRNVEEQLTNDNHHSILPRIIYVEPAITL